MTTVLVIGATGNIGTSAIIAALRNKHSVLAIVRNQASAEKLYTNVGSRDGITTVEADIMSDQGVISVVEKVRRGDLPAFQHVFAAAGGIFEETPLLELTTEKLREHFAINFEPNVWAYQATIPYLIEKKDPSSTWTLITGASGDNGFRPAASMTQGALFSLVNSAINETKTTNVRVNEIYLGLFVMADEDLAKHYGAMTASEFGRSYEKILTSPDLRGARIKVLRPEDLSEWKIDQKA